MKWFTESTNILFWRVGCETTTRFIDTAPSTYSINSTYLYNTNVNVSSRSETGLNDVGVTFCLYSSLFEDIVKKYPLILFFSRLHYIYDIISWLPD